MKTFEEKWTAWIDGELSAAELAEFEAALPDRAAAEAEKGNAHKLGAFLKENMPARAMGNEEFFHHQLRQRIAEDARSAAPESTSRASEPGAELGRAPGTKRPRSRALVVRGRADGTRR